MTTTRPRPLAPWDPTAAHRFVTSDGTALHVEDVAPAGGAELTVILLHGWTLDHTEWQPVVHTLTADGAVNRGLRVIRYDHRGHGGSAPAEPGTATIAQLADDLAELIADRVAEGPIVLVGHSMGGATIMAFAERHPELLPRIAGAVFMATTSGGLDKITLGLPRWLSTGVTKAERRVNRRLSKIRRTSLSRRTALMRPALRWLVFGKKPNRRDVADTADQLGRGNPASIAGFRISLGVHERREALAALRDKPTIVLAGGADRLLPLPHARIIADALGAELVIYPDAGHMLNVERTVGVAERIAHVIDLAGSREG
ncbi:MAG TPA: alpha/beta hydrolase [Pseudonocardiaceae bacterium]|nr:alpha/beta hydrolase [Pseudonocardiaceae bacterium]